MRYTITLEHQGKRYSFLDDYDYQGWDEARNADYQVTYLYTEGNQSCDCNRSALIRDWCDADFPEMQCGETITLISIADEAGRVIWPEHSYMQRSSGLYVPLEVTL